MFRKLCNIHAIDNNLPFIHTPDTRDCIQCCGFSGTISTNNSNKISGIQIQIHSIKRHLLIDRSRVKSLMYILNFK